MYDSKPTVYGILLTVCLSFEIREIECIIAYQITIANNIYLSIREL